jgi:NADPH-dependent glutamate synthase beta subunit-like oxidoreductase
MDQKELRELERRCIQEEAPACTARCPIHVDIRTFIKNAASGLWDEALQVLAERMPLPGIVGRICDHPCEAVCIRTETINISGLERVTVERGRIRRRQTPLPEKAYRVAVSGSGLSSLTAAWDLALKGYRVTILDRPGDKLPHILPREIIK